MTRYWWIRHGPVHGIQTLRGQEDVPCDLSDTQRILSLRQRLPEKALVVASPLRRAVTTARTVTGRDPDCLDRGFLEQDFGSWSSMTWDDINTQPEAAEFWQNPAATRCPQGESFADQFTRVSQAIASLSSLHQDEDVLCFCHAGTIRSALALALGLDEKTLACSFSFSIDPLSLTRIDALDDVFRIDSVNERFPP